MRVFQAGVRNLKVFDDVSAVLEQAFLERHYRLLAAPTRSMLVLHLKHADSLGNVGHKFMQ